MRRSFQSFWPVLLAVVLLAVSSDSARASCDTVDEQGRWYPSGSSTTDQCLKTKGRQDGKSLVITKAALPMDDLDREIPAFRGKGGSLVFDDVSIQQHHGERGFLSMSKWAWRSYDLNTLGRYCNQFKTFAVVQTPCGIKMEAFLGDVRQFEEYKRTGVLPPGLKSVSWPEEKNPIGYLPRGLTFSRVHLKNVGTLWLGDVVVNGSIIVDDTHVDAGDLRIELKRCVVIGDVIISNAKNTTILVDRCVIFGKLRLTDSVRSELLVGDSAIEEDVSLVSLKDTSIQWLRPVDIRGDLRLKDVELWHDDRIGPLTVGGALSLDGVDETAPAGKESIGLFTREIDVKGPITVRNSVLVRTRRILGREPADIAMDNVRFIEPAR